MSLEIRANGSKWAGQSPDPVETLLALLKSEPLDPRFEDYGDFVMRDETWPNVHVWGNFFNVSHCFDIKGTPAECAAIVAAIRENQRRADYRAIRLQREAEAAARGAR